jgi:hypothetical protein
MLDDFIFLPSHPVASVTNPTTVIELTGIRIAAITGSSRPCTAKKIPMEL